MSFEEKIKKIVSEKLGVVLEEVTADSNFEDDLGASSVEIADLLVAIEEEFGIHFAEENKGEIRNVGQVIKLAESQADLLL